MSARQQKWLSRQSLHDLWSSTVTSKNYDRTNTLNVFPQLLSLWQISLHLTEHLWDLTCLQLMQTAHSSLPICIANDSFASVIKKSGLGQISRTMSVFFAQECEPIQVDREYRWKTTIPEALQDLQGKIFINWSWTDQPHTETVSKFMFGMLWSTWLIHCMFYCMINE